MSRMILSVGKTQGNLFPLADGVVEISGEIVPEIARKKFVLGGTGCVRRNVLRKFTVTADRIAGDPAQEFLLSDDTCLGVYSDSVFAYSYVDEVSGEGEYGSAVADVIVEKNAGGSPDVFVAEIYSCRIPSRISQGGE